MTGIPNKNAYKLDLIMKEHQPLDKLKYTTTGLYSS